MGDISLVQKLDTLDPEKGQISLRIRSGNGAGLTSQQASQICVKKATNSP